MNTRELACYRSLLENQLADNSSHLGLLRRKFLDHKRPEPGDSVDCESEVSDFGLLDRLSHFEMMEQREIKAALQRIDDGLFGVCVSCKEMIPSARLEAKPYAIRCVGCQAEQDLAEAASEMQKQATEKVGFAV